MQREKKKEGEKREGGANETNKHTIKRNTEQEKRNIHNLKKKF